MPRGAAANVGRCVVMEKGGGGRERGERSLKRERTKQGQTG